MFRSENNTGLYKGTPSDDIFRLDISMFKIGKFDEVKSNHLKWEKLIIEKDEYTQTLNIPSRLYAATCFIPAVDSKVTKKRE